MWKTLSFWSSTSNKSFHSLFKIGYCLSQRVTQTSWLGLITLPSLTLDILTSYAPSLTATHSSEKVL